MDYEIGLVLSGGGTKGMGHIGVLKAMEELGVNADIIAGTSAGAIIGALYASGVSSDEMFNYMSKLSLFNFKNYAWSKPGFIDGLKFQKDLLGLLRYSTFEELHKPLFIITTDLLNARQKIFSTGDLVQPIMGSSAFPGLFSPVEFEGTYYVDGGILNNFPTEVIRSKCQHMIGVHVQSISKIEKKKIGNTIGVMQRIYAIMTRADATTKYNECDVLIAPKEMMQYNTFELKKFKEMYDIGYEHGKKQLESYFEKIK